MLHNVGKPLYSGLLLFTSLKFGFSNALKQSVYTWGKQTTSLGYKCKGNS